MNHPKTGTYCNVTLLKGLGYGLSMSLYGTKQLQRMGILVLIGTIAHTLLML
ncbi:hypothetical protein VIBNISOn1_p0083 [Vibrio nigripulchritudo SOn1]|uniref:Uncharacterized protein n=1 Tax=Vibrio nigripulchritudo SOn1 TaxID=1238450 RepID=A0AAV2VZQ3_9VIBR|nr:hypothetical protein VIBNISOn1_p0083 [Vibrio nigripulchritudo SOn1]